MSACWTNTADVCPQLSVETFLTYVPVIMEPLCQQHYLCKQKTKLQS